MRRLHTIRPFEGLSCGRVLLVEHAVAVRARPGGRRSAVVARRSDMLKHVHAILGDTNRVYRLNALLGRCAFVTYTRKFGREDTIIVTLNDPGACLDTILASRERFAGYGVRLSLDAGRSVIEGLGGNLFDVLLLVEARRFISNIVG